MTNELHDHYIDEDELEKSIESGEITPVHIPRFTSFSEIINVNKSEISKLFAYNLKEFSQERIRGFVESLLAYGAEINMEAAWNQIKSRSKKLERKLGIGQAALEA